MPALVHSPPCSAWRSCSRSPAVALADVTGPARVIDGDTIEITGERICLHGIDAPESGQSCRRQGVG